jgi:hypothetical protein
MDVLGSEVAFKARAHLHVFYANEHKNISLRTDWALILMSDRRQTQPYLPSRLIPI